MDHPRQLQDAEIASLVERMGVEPQRTRGVLIVDDERLNLTVLRDVLEDHYTVHTAASGEEALRLADQVPLDVVVTDQRMPGMTGVELLTELRRRRPELAGIVLTAYTDAQALEAAINQASRLPLHPQALGGRRDPPRDRPGRPPGRAAAHRGAARHPAGRSQPGPRRRRSRRLKAQQEAILNLERLGTIGRLSAGLMHDLKNVVVALRAAEWEMARTTTAGPLKEIHDAGHGRGGQPPAHPADPPGLLADRHARAPARGGATRPPWSRTPWRSRGWTSPTGTRRVTSLVRVRACPRSRPTGRSSSRSSSTSCGTPSTPRRTAPRSPWRSRPAGGSSSSAWRTTGRACRPSSRSASSSPSCRARATRGSASASTWPGSSSSRTAAASRSATGRRAGPASRWCCPPRG